jgi:hypothetical protein
VVWKVWIGKGGEKYLLWSFKGEHGYMCPTATFDWRRFSEVLGFWRLSGVFLWVNSESFWGRISTWCSSLSKTLFKLKFWEIVPCDETFPKWSYKLNLELYCKSCEGWKFVETLGRPLRGQRFRRAKTFVVCINFLCNFESVCIIVIAFQKVITFMIWSSEKEVMEVWRLGGWLPLERRKLRLWGP